MSIADRSQSSAQPKRRVDSVDLLRGLIMVIMMLDHTRDFIHREAFLFDPTDLAKTYPLLFFTRWITHFCAPLFVFLAGTAAYFQEMRGKPKSELSRFLVTRGAWLVAIELFVIRPLIFFNFHFAGVVVFLQVIWAIGWSMIVLAAVIRLPIRAIAIGSVAVIALHNLLDGVKVTNWAGPGTPAPGFWASIWHVLHVPGVIFPLGSSGPPGLVLYPLIPWIAVMSAGYAFGSVFRLEAEQRRRILLRLGAALTAGFVIIRALNIYGDASKWSVQATTVKTLISFLNTSKYPPSLLYLLMTIGPALLFLAWFDERARGRVSNFFIVYGRVPLFFYLLQWATSHLLAVVASVIAGKPVAFLFSDLGFSPPPPKDFGFGLGMVYLLWIVGVALLYPLCKWYAGVKARRNDWWLSYL